MFVNNRKFKLEVSFHFVQVKKKSYNPCIMINFAFNQNFFRLFFLIVIDKLVRNIVFDLEISTLEGSTIVTVLPYSGGVVNSCIETICIGGVNGDAKNLLWSNLVDDRTKRNISFIRLHRIDCKGLGQFLMTLGFC